MSDPILSADNPLLQSFMFYGAILMLKMIALSFCTSICRQTKGVFANPEDAHFKQGKVYEDSDVERVRRAHRNDMENIYVFLILGLFYVLTDPKLSRATMLFRIFTGARVLHSIVYIGGVRQPARALCYMVGQLVNIYMVWNVVLTFM